MARVIERRIADPRRTADPVYKLFELSVDMLGTASAEGYFTRLNPAWERTLGWTRDELMAKPFISFVHPDDVDETLAQAAQLSGSRKPMVVAFENRYRRRDGDYRCLEWTTVSDGGDMYFVAKDVTDRRLAEIVHARSARVQTQQLAVSELGSLDVRRDGQTGLVQRAADILFSCLGADMAAVFEHTDEGGATVRAGAGEPIPPPPVPPTASSRRSFALIRNSGQPLLSADIRRDERFAGPTLREQGMVSIVAAPIGAGTGGFGFLGAASRQEGAFSEDDLAFVKSVANAVSAAIDRERAVARATEAESRIANLWQLSRDLLAVLDSDGTFLEVNAAWERTLGWAPEELVGKSGIDFVHPDDVAETLASADLTGRPGGSVPETVNRYRAKDGTWRRLLWSVHQAPDGVLYTVAKDITEMHDEYERGRQQEERLNEAQRIGLMGSWESDLISGEFIVSESLRSMLALRSLAVSFADVFDRVHPDDRAYVEAKFAERSVDPAPTEFRAVLPDGSVRIVASHAEPVLEDGRVILVRGLVRDVTTERSRELALRRSDVRFRQAFDNAPIPMNLVDPASGKYTRVNDAFCRFLDRPAEELLTLSPVDVTYCDDVEGTDEAMHALASRELSTYTAEKRYVRADGSLVWGDLSVSTTLDADGSVDVIFGQVVDITERKEREEAMRLQLGEVAWLTEIKQALEDDRFELHAQPIIEIATREIVDHELLIRMRDRDGVLIPPGDFLPAAEKYGPIKEIDRWVICRGAQIAARGTMVSVNLSGASLADPTLASHVQSELERSGATASHLTFEITETALIEASETATHLMEQIRGLGCRFALDDFGTGFGALQHLRTLPLDFLKIDQEFVRSAVTSEKDRHIIWAVVNLARLFGLKTVAEGVEDQETLDLLAEMDVDYAQGYYLGRPGPLDGDRVQAASPDGTISPGPRRPDRRAYRNSRVCVAVFHMDDSTLDQSDAGREHHKQRLRTASRDWQQLLRAQDSLAVLGDDLVVRLAGCASGDAARTVRRLQSSTPTIQWSAGLAIWDHAESPSALLDRAVQASTQAQLTPGSVKVALRDE